MMKDNRRDEGPRVMMAMIQIESGKRRRRVGTAEKVLNQASIQARDKEKQKYGESKRG